MLDFQGRVFDEPGRGATRHLADLRRLSPPQLTVICTDLECLKLPLLPRTVNVVVWPLVALELTVTFSVEVAPVEELVTDEGLNEPLVPLGNPLTLRFTVLGPLTCVIVTVYVPVIPRFTVSEVGVTAIVKSAEAVTVKEVVPEIVPDAA